MMALSRVGARRRGGLFIALAVAVLTVAAGCGSPVDEVEYGELNREAFMAACTDSTDDRLVRDVCDCTYDEIEANVALVDLAALEVSLRLDTFRSLPDTIAGYLADCFVVEAEL